MVVLSVIVRPAGSTYKGPSRRGYHPKSVWLAVPAKAHLAGGTIQSPSGWEYLQRSIWQRVPFKVRSAGGTYKGPSSRWYHSKSVSLAVPLKFLLAPRGAVLQVYYREPFQRDLAPTPAATSCSSTSF